MRLLFLLILVFTTSQGWAALRPGSDDASNYEECSRVSEITYLTVDCYETFHHYHPETAWANPYGSVRLGSYNIFRSGEEHNKRLDINAQMIDSEWDIVALTELQPNQSFVKDLNDNAIIAYASDGISFEEFEAAYHIPAYVRLLMELQKLDDSWGLIVTGFTQGTDFEIKGFLYRASTVELADSNYCYANSGEFESFACMVNFEDEFDNTYFNKHPFMARFRSDNFDFNYFTTHIRFNGEGEFKGQCVSDCQDIVNTMIEKIADKFTDDEKRQSFLDKIGYGGEISSPTARMLQRFFETILAADAANKMREIEDDNDIIIAGDFNLEYTDNNRWQGMLWRLVEEIMGGGSVLIKEPTSISVKKGHNKNYDHFIINTKEGFADECDADSAQVVDFLDPFLFLSSGYDLAGELDRYKDPAEYEDIIENFIEAPMQDRLWVDDLGEIYNFDEMLELELVRTNRELQRRRRECTEDQLGGGDKIWMNMIDAAIADKMCKTMYIDFHEPYLRYKHTMSDHLPISLTCNTW